MLFEAPELGAPEESVLAQIADLQQRLQLYLHEPRRWYGSLRRAQFARAVQGSNSIEGINVELDDAAAIDLGEEPLDADQETRLAIEGYRDAMTYVIQLATDSDFMYSERLLKSLHFMMTSYDRKANPGLWRPGAIWIRNEETGTIVYEGAAVDEVPALVHELVTGLDAPSDLPAIVRAALAHLNLVMIHPFSDGNGRMSRCLQTLVLARGGVLSPVFGSIEEYLGRNTEAYYDVLARVGGGSWHPDRDARAWLRFCLTAHLRQARTMLTRIREAERLWSDLEKLVSDAGLPERTIDALYDAAIGYRVRNATYRAVRGDELSEQAAGRDLRQLTDAGLLVPVGEKRGRFYVGSPRVKALRQAIIDSRDPRDDRDPFDPA
jgi:Fic family protein